MRGERALTSSPAAIYAFIVRRTLVNGARRQLGKLRSPRYAVALVFGLAYLFFMMGAPGVRHSPAPRIRLGNPSEEMALLAAAALTFWSSLRWLFGWSTPALPLSEADIQILMPAPLTRRSIVQFAFLRSQLPLLVSSTIFTLVSAGGFSGRKVLLLLGLWLTFTTIHFHFLAMALLRAHVDGLPAERRLRATVALNLAAVVCLAVTLGWAGWGVALILAKYSLIAPVGTVEAWRHFSPARWLLAPFGATFAPMMAPNARSLAAALPAAFGMALVQYALAVRYGTRFEDATVASAEKRARRRGRGRQSLVPLARRGVQPFSIAGRGWPELAIVWKSFLAWKRARLLPQAALWLVAIPAGCLVLVHVLALWGPRTFAAALTLTTASAPLLALALLQPLMLRNDLRSDLALPTIVRTWPLSARRLVVAELLGPLVLSMLRAWGAIAATLAAATGLLTGAHSALGGRGQQLRGFFANLELGPIAAAASALAVIVPAILALLLVVGNIAVTAFPAWFPPGPGRTTGIAAAGERMIYFLASLVTLTVAAFPSGVLTWAVVHLTYPLLGPWSLVPAAAAASVPLWLEAGAGVMLVARLFERSDPAEDNFL